MPQLIQASFGKGEIAPSLYGRVDTAVYSVALKTARNVVIHTHGGASNRGGLRYRGPAMSMDERSVLIPFHFNNEDKYVLEFGNQRMRVIRDGSHVTTNPQIVQGVNLAAGTINVTSHGYSTGDEIFVEGIGGTTQLNGRRFIVALIVDADNFEVADVFTGTEVEFDDYDPWTSEGTCSLIYENDDAPWILDHLPDVRYVQSADKMTMVHPEYPVYELVRTNHDDWTFSVPTFEPRTDYPTGITVTAGDVGAQRARYKVTAVADDESLPGLATSTAVVITAITNADPASVTATAHSFLTNDEVEINDVVGMTELNGRRFLIDKVDANTFTLRDMDSTDLTAYASAGTATRTFGEVLNENIADITAANPAVVTLPAGHGLVADIIVNVAGVEGMTEVNNRQYTTATVTATSLQLKNVDSTAYTAYTSGGALWRDNTSKNVIAWGAVAGADHYRVYKEHNGQYGFVGQTDALSFTEANILPDTLDGPPYQRNPFNAIDDYPQAVGLYEQRRVFGGSVNEPDTSYYSAIGSGNNFNVHNPIQDDDPITVTLASQEINEIRHFVPLQDLLVMTSGGEWRVTAGPDSVFAATGIKQKPQTYFGCSNLKPLVSGNTVLFAEASNANVRTLSYSFQIDGFTGTDVGLLAPHLLYTDTIKDWAIAGNPDNRIHIVRSDGDALTITYDEEQNVTAWTRWDTLGEFESVAALRRTTGEHHDRVFYCVKRTIGGHTVRYIEEWDQTPFEEVQDCFFVDAGATYDNPVAITGVTVGLLGVVTVTAPGHGLSDGDDVDISDIEWVHEFDDNYNETNPSQLSGRYTVLSTAGDAIILDGVDGSDWTAYVRNGVVRKPVSTISGYDFLAGETDLVGLLDGNTVSGLSCSPDGVIELPHPTSRAHIGLRFIADLETLDIESPGGGTIQGLMKKINFVVVKFERTRGLLIGPDSNHLFELKQRDAESYGEPTKLLTGNTAKVFLESAWNSNGRVFLRQRYPLPFTVLSIIPNLEVGTFEDNS